MKKKTCRGKNADQSVACNESLRDPLHFVAKGELAIASNLQPMLAATAKPGCRALKCRARRRNLSRRSVSFIQHSEFLIQNFPPWLTSNTIPPAISCAGPMAILSTVAERRRAALARLHRLALIVPMRRRVSST
jgi:hypothetical protein